MTNSPLKWAGGKTPLIPALQSLYTSHQHRRWVDPFCGSLALPLALQPQRALLSDINPHLINFWQWVQSDGVIDPSEYQFVNNETEYYRLRDRFNESGAPPLFYYLNRTGYNGLCRFNQSGFFNVPFGKYQKINYRDNFTEYQPVMCDWVFVNQTWQQTLSQLEPNDFVYLDPPYDDGFTQYAGNLFDWEEQKQLALAASRHSGPVVASNKATDRIVSLYWALGFDVQIISMPRRISCRGDRTPVDEMLATKNV